MSAPGYEGDSHHHHLSEALHDLKVGIIHKKHAWGKLGNLINRNHRHDEEHEKGTDDKRTKIAESHRFNSFAPEREGNEVKWFVDGRDYFWAVSEILENAKETIYIADWWLSPELFLRRQPYHNQEYRLDQILKRKAEQGVKIYVMVYKEIEAAISCNSNHTKEALHNLCPEGTKGHGNIKCLRHPDHNAIVKGADMTFYWAHHEKILVVDYNIACVGGLDLCFGRYDSSTHELSDVHPAGVPEEIWPGQDFNNNRVLDFQNVDDWTSNKLSKAEYGRMPWHDVHMMIIGGSVIDVAEHFVLRWNFIKRDKYKRDETVPWLEMEGRLGPDLEDLIGVQRPKHPVGGYLRHPLTPIDTKNLANQGNMNVQVLRSSADWSSGILTEHSIQNAYIHTILNAKHYVYIENQFFITATGDQQKPIENTIGAAIVNAVVRAAKEGRKFRIIVLIPAVPGFAGDLRDDAAKGTRQIMDYQYKSICRGEHSIYGQIKKEGVDPEQYIFFFNLRAYDRLNVTPAMKKQEEVSGVSYQEVQKAGADQIMGEIIGEDTVNAESNFGSPMPRPNSNNKDKDSFDPKKSDQGNQAKSSSADQQEQTDKMRRYEEARDPETDEQAKQDDSLAKHAMLGTGSLSAAAFDGKEADEVDLWVQEELYIHCKVLIADDEIVICGSANLNDRSQCGDHDSEIAVYLEDNTKIDSVIDGKPTKVSQFATSLRRQLWREHLGMLPHKEHNAEGDDNARPPPIKNVVDIDEHWNFVEDPLSDDVWKVWTDRATTNTRVYREMFHADPDNYVKNFDDYDKYLPAKGQKAGHIYNRFTSAADIRAKLDTIQGHLVWMPLGFLRDVKLEDHNTGIEVNSFTASIYT